MHRHTRRFGLPGAGAAPGGGRHAVRGALPPVGGPAVRLRPAGQLLLPHRAPQCRSSVREWLGRGQPGGCGCPTKVQLCCAAAKPSSQTRCHNSADLCPAQPIPASQLRPRPALPAHNTNCMLYSTPPAAATSWSCLSLSPLMRRRSAG